MNFSSKILLFGEYTLITGSRGLAFPLPQFSGQFDKKTHCDDVQTHLHLGEFCHYMQGSSLLSEALNLKKFEADIHDGVFFNSNIPHGYGIGSSGALCAAVYAHYAYDFNRKETYADAELKRLKDMMALMEGFYHGTSSGMDCLISLVNSPVLIQERNSFDLIASPDLDGLGRFFLYDSGQGRKTASFVHHFLQKYKTDPAYKQETENLSHVVNDLIDQTCAHNKAHFKDQFYDLSHRQYLHFADMIPDHVKGEWLKGLETRQYLFKLCGAGGGGFFLIYSDDPDYIAHCPHLCV